MNQKLLGLMATVLLFASACNKDDDGPSAGKGGAAILRASAQHHRPPSLDSMMIYIKYNATQPPVDGSANVITSAFDDSARVVITPTDTVAIFTGLKNGAYYLYGLGWDPKIGQVVKGGTGYTITQQQSIRLIVPVTEGD